MVMRPKVLVILIIVWCFSPVWAQWDSFKELKTDSGHLNFEYLSPDKQIRWTVKKGTFGKKRTRGPFHLGAPEFHSFLDELIKDLRSIKAPDSEINNLLTSVEEIRFTIHSGCANIPISTSDKSTDSSLGPLLNEIKSIERKIAEESEIYKSQKLTEINVPGGIKIVLRGESDRNGELKNVAIFTIPADAKVNVVHHEDGYVIQNSSNKNLLSFRVGKIDDRNFIYINKKLYEDSWHDYEHELLEIVHQGSRITLKPISSDIVHSATEKNGVSLTTNEATHFPVKRLNDNGDYIPLADQRALKEKSEVILNSESFDWFMSKAAPQFERCMQYFVLQRSEGLISTHDEILKNYCEEISIWSTIDKYAGEILEREGLRDLSPSKIQLIKSKLNQCLVQQNIIDRFGVFAYKYPDQNFSNSAEQCHRSFLLEVLKLQAQEKLAQIHLPQDNNPELRKAFETDVMNRGFDTCVAQKKLIELRSCLVHVENMAMSSRFLTDISIGMLRYQKGRGSLSEKLVSDFKKCEDKQSSMSNPEMYLSNLKKCSIDLVQSVEENLIEENISQLAREIPEFGDEIIKEISWISEKQKLRDCLNIQLNRTQDFDEFKDLQESKRFYCRMQIFKEKIPELYVRKHKDFISKILSSSSDQTFIQDQLKNSMSLNLEKFNSVADINNYLEMQYPVLLSLTVKKFYENRCSHFKLECNQQSDLEKRLKLVIGSSDRRPFGQSLLKYFSGLSEKTDERGLEIHALDLSRSVSREMASNLENQNHIELYQSCLESFRPNKDNDFYAHNLKCDKLLFAMTHFDESKEKYTKLVSQYFPVSEYEANLILTPMTYYKDCLLSLDLDNKLDFEVFSKKVTGCDLVLSMEINSNIFEMKAKGMSSLMRTQENSQLLTQTRACTFNAIAEIERELNFRAQNNSEPGHSERLVSTMYMDNVVKTNGQMTLLSLMDSSLNFDYKYKYGDKKVLDRFFDQIASSGSITIENFDQKMKDCRERSDEAMFTSFREFIVSKIPVLYTNAENKRAQDEVMKSFFDFELLDLILKYTKHHAGRFDSRSDSAPIGQRLVTTELSLRALSNFVGIMGDYLGKGYFFDPAQMKTELVVFQGELKDFLEWALTQSKQPTIDEFKEFFRESKLADHLAIAVLSEQVRNQFGTFIENMKQSELDAFLVSKGKRAYGQLSNADKLEFQKIQNKYTELVNLSIQMTSSYDFRRIIRPQGQKGEKLINDIKQMYLLPKLLGLTPRPQSVQEIQKQIGAFILADNTDGGFTERFVAQMAQQTLDEDSKSHWGITKWLFYDDGDFDWNKLRNTKSGREAINYYGRYILLPKILGQSLSSQVEALRHERFKKLVLKAQSENG
ncbi:MAG: hypothetical protein Fur0010_17260 [Bdellovibrio sp.]